MSTGNYEETKSVIYMTFDSTVFGSMVYTKKEKVLLIFFTSGKNYLYHDVPPDVIKGLKDAKSKGRYFHQFIRDIYE
jgi:hypothetical protein